MEGLPSVGFFDHVRVSDLSSVRNPHFSSSRRGGHGVFDELRWVIQWWKWDYVVIFLRLHKGIQGSGELHLTMMPPGSLGQAFLQFLKSYIDMPAQDDMGQLLGLGVLITQGLGVFFWVSWIYQRLSIDFNEFPLDGCMDGFRQLASPSYGPRKGETKKWGLGEGPPPSFFAQTW